MSCCTKTYDLGCFNQCGSIAFGEATQTQTITAVLEFSFMHVQQTINAVSGQPYVLNLRGLNESAKFTVKFYDSTGAPMTITIDNVQYDCLSFSTMFIYGCEDTEAESESTCCTPKVIEVTGEDSYVLQASEWEGYGTPPRIEVMAKTDGVYRRIPIVPEYDDMPVPTEITISLPGTPPDTWYIVIS